MSSHPFNYMAHLPLREWGHTLDGVGLWFVIRAAAIPQRFWLRKRSEKLSELLGVHVRDLSLGSIDNVLGSGLLGNTLGVDFDAFGLSFLLGLVVGVDAVDESLAGSGLTDVLNTEMETLGDNAAIDALVDNDTNGVPGNIEDLAGLTLVELVGHTTLATAVSNHINVISLLEDGEEVLQTNGTVLTVGLGEQISSASSKTKAVWHL